MKISWSSRHKWSTEAGGLAVYCFYFLHPFQRGAIILQEIWVRRQHFISCLREGAPFGKLGGGWCSLILMSKLCWRLAGVSFNDLSSTWRAFCPDQVFYWWPNLSYYDHHPNSWWLDVGWLWMDTWNRNIPVDIESAPTKKDKWHTNRLEKLAHNHSAQWSGRLNKSNHYYFVTTLSLLAVAFIQTYFTCDGKL